VELLIESKNRYEHLVFEDMKPSGCEPVELRSGSRYADGLCSNMELRDEKVAFFVTQLPQGRRLITYRLRAEAPGRFHALPLNGYAMYAPDVRCISSEAQFTVQDAPAAP
jgi:alpha-2-macroglobulin